MIEKVVWGVVDERWSIYLTSLGPVLGQEPGVAGIVGNDALSLPILYLYLNRRII